MIIVTNLKISDSVGRIWLRNNIAVNMMFATFILIGVMWLILFRLPSQRMGIYDYFKFVIVFHP